MDESSEVGTMTLSSAQPLRILVVDDSADARDSLALLLRLWGHETQAVGDGLTALALADSYQPHVVFLDLSMPGMDGCEVARRLRRQARDVRPLVLSLSGYGREEDRFRALQAGCDQHWVKPADPQQLQRLLATFSPGNKDHERTLSLNAR